jgi:dihydroflavonol-4-reductase
LKTLVLGATGHIGSVLARRLVEAGRPVRALVRSSSDRRPIAGLDIECVIGDVLDRGSLDRAFHGCDTVFHLAASSGGDPNVIAVATRGTRNVVDAMEKCSTITRAVYTSSTVTVGYSADPGTRLDETTFSRTNASPYHTAKFEAEAWLRGRVAETRAPVVIVNPCVTIGPNDFRPTDANRFVLDYMRRPLPFYFAGGVTVADVDDVARGHLLALERGVPGQRYILGGDCVTVREHLTEVARLLGVRPPRVRIPKSALMVAAGVGAVVGALSRYRFPLRAGVVRHVVGRYAYYSSAKAAADLGYTWRAHREAVERTVRWFQRADVSAVGQAWS